MYAVNASTRLPLFVFLPFPTSMIFNDHVITAVSYNNFIMSTMRMFKYLIFEIILKNVPAEDSDQTHGHTAIPMHAYRGRPTWIQCRPTRIASRNKVVVRMNSFPLFLWRPTPVDAQKALLPFVTKECCRRFSHDSNPRIWPCHLLVGRAGIKDWPGLPGTERKPTTNQSCHTLP